MLIRASTPSAAKRVLAKPSKGNELKSCEAAEPWVPGVDRSPVDLALSRTAAVVSCSFFRDWREEFERRRACVYSCS